MIIDVKDYKTIKVKKNYFQINKFKYYTGTIISTKGSLLINKHYGIFYCIDENDDILILHNTVIKDKKKSSIVISSLSEFVIVNDKIKIELKIPYYNEQFANLILNRAIEFSKNKFHTKYNNCEHFVNYCVHNKKKSSQSIYLDFFEFSINSLYDTYIESFNDEYIKKRKKRILHGIYKLF